jgi:hypothetical protein
MIRRFVILSALLNLFWWQFAAADVVTNWNSVALDAIRVSNTTPPMAARNLAILHASIYDAVNGIRGTYKPYFVTGMAPGDTSMEAASAAAAYRVLVTLYPSLQSQFQRHYEETVSRIQNGAAKIRGIQWGDSVALVILQWRSGDGSSKFVTYTPGTEPGQWRPTVSFGGIVRPALLPQWGSVQPFALVSGSQFRPPPPPPLNSVQYASEVNMVKALGDINSLTRTQEQTESANFWGYGPGTATPPGHWNQIAQAVVKDRDDQDVDELHTSRRNTIERNARLFALINIAMADAAIVSWDSKYVYNLWRPITAIQEADTDGNEATEPDRNWTPLLETPPFPEYTSGHSTLSGAAAVVLASFFGSDRMRFSVGSDDLPGVFRSYRSFSEAAFESGLSRIYGGIHFMSANVHGLSTGAATGIYVAWNFLTPVGKSSSRLTQ